MTTNKSFPIFKILAVMCLTIVSIVQITVMSDNASEYNQISQLADAEYMTIFYYVIGFAFLASTFFTVFSVGKRNSSVITTAIEFLVIIVVGYYFKEHYELDYDVDKITYLAILIPVIYIEKLELVAGFSVAALFLGILDATVGSSFNLSSNVNECMYCGKRLRPGEKCTCDLDDSYVINDFDTDPENYADDVEKRKCVFCGRLLYGTEKCNCPETKRREAEAEAKKRGGFSVDKPTYTPPPPRDMSPPVNRGFGEAAKPAGKPENGTFINKPFITKPTLTNDTPHSSAPTYKPADVPKTQKSGDERFFSKPTDL